jgi:beta-lactamase class A
MQIAVLAATLIVGVPAKAIEIGALDGAVTRAESALRARIGVAVIDTASGTVWQRRGGERFPLNSTHKVFSCAAALARADRHEMDMEAVIPIDTTALVAYSPVTAKVPAGGTMSLRQLCRAAVSFSDNTAANLVAGAIGGPTAVTAFLRAIGDGTTRLDRLEPELNQAAPGDVRDTTTPLAAAESLQSLLLGDALSRPARAELRQWMLNDRVADALLRSGLPKDWRVADKSGAGGHGSRSIIAVAWPPERPPVVVAIYITQTDAPMAARDHAIAHIGSALATAFR